MTSNEQTPAPVERRMTPDDLRHVQFTRSTRRREGYDEAQVDRFLDRVAGELARSIQERGELRDRVSALQRQVEGAEDQVRAQVPPSEQALRIIAAAQQTADAYVADAEDFSQQMTRDARVQYEEQLRQARENAGAIIQAAQEAAAGMTGGTPQEVPEGTRPSTEQLEQQVAYLKAFGQAVRTQLRTYLEGLLTHVEGEWGRADPAALPAAAAPTLAERAGQATAAVPPGPRNVAAELPPDDSRDTRADGAARDAGPVRVYGGG